jgi:hypothetical protein
MLEHLAICPACADVREELREAASGLRAALVPDAWAEARADDELARRVMSHPEITASADGAPLIPRTGVLWRTHTLRAAAALAACATGYAAWRVAGPDRPDYEQIAAAYRLAPPSVPDYAGPRFEDVTAESGIRAAPGEAGTPADPAKPKDWMIELTGHGATVFDFDGDGDMDLFFPGRRPIDASERAESSWRLWRNDGALRFTDVTVSAGLAADGWGSAAVAGDLDADGFPDLFVACWGEDRLFRNRGDGTFEDTTAQAGVAGLHEEWGTGAALGDLDGDGDLDLYVANYADMRRYMQETGKGRGCTWRTMPVACGPTPLVPQQDRLFENRGDGTFTDATTSRLPKLLRYSFQPVIADVDGDGALDIYVAADAQPNVLLMNDGTGQFADVAFRAGCSSDGEGRDQASMGVAAGDVDGDGRLDLFVTNFSHEPNCLYRNVASGAGLPSFRDVTAPARLEDVGFLTLGWGAALVDFDADGDLDLAYANGHLYSDVEKTVPETSYAQHVAVHRNDGSGRFTEVSSDAGAVIRPRVYRGLSTADLDDDGCADLVATVLDAPPVVLKSDGRGVGRSARFILRRADGKTEAAGAVLVAKVMSGGTTKSVRRDLLLGTSFGGSEDPRVHVGAGADGEIASFTVRWPHGAAQEFPGVETAAPGASAVYEVVEGRAEVRRVR